MGNSLFEKFDFNRFLQVLLILGIVFLAYNDKDGWGWLTFILFITVY